MSAKCPKCDSVEVEFFDYMGVKALKCLACGYDESLDYEVFPEERETQREKSRFSPYKKGGKGRTRK